MMKLEWETGTYSKQGSHFPLPFFSFLETQNPVSGPPSILDTHRTRELPKAGGSWSSIKKIDIQLSGSQMILSWEDFDENN